MRVVLKVPPAVMWSVFFVFLSYLDKNFVKGEFPNYSLDTKKESKDVFFMLNSTFCTKMSGIRGNVLYQVSNGIEEVRSVYDPVRKLVDCSVTTNKIQVKAFMHGCRLGLKDQRINSEDMELSFADMADAKYNCQLFQRNSKRSTVITERIGAQTAQLRDKRENSVHEKNEQVLHRSKRGFTYPGTLWCGAGNMADNYDDLGEFAATDSCCRVHDHCPYVIHAFSSNYGYTNFKWHPLSHCDCDNALKNCLRKVNDTSSRVVGQAFFNVIEVPCFEFKYEEQCVERHWYGTCKRYDMLPVAVLRESIGYDFGGIDVIDVLTLAPLVQKETKKTESKRDENEGTTQSTVSDTQTAAPEEPSLRNVFTAAEDFIKVLATVSTSQGTTIDTAKGETQTSEKKKRKNSEGTKKKNNKRKGKGRKKKKQKMVSNGAEEGITVTPTKAEEVVNKRNFVNKPEKVEQLNRKVNSFTNGERDLGGKEEFKNDVMRDEPRADDQSAADASGNSVTAVKKEQIVRETLSLTDPTEKASIFLTAATPIVTTQKNTRQRSRKGDGRKKHSYTPTVPNKRLAPHNANKEDLPNKTTEKSVIPNVPASNAIISVEQPEPQRLEIQSEKEAVTAMAASRTPIVTSMKSKRHRSNKSEKRNKIRKITSFPPRVGFMFQNLTAGDFKGIPRESSSTLNINPNITVTADQPMSYRPESYIETGSVTVIAVTSTPSVLKTKRQRPKQRVGRKMGSRTTGSSEGASLQKTRGRAAETLNTHNADVLHIPTIATGVTAEHTERLAPQSIDIHHGKGHFTVTASRHSTFVTRRRHGLKEQDGRKKRKVLIPTVVNNGFPIYNDIESKREEITTPICFTPSASKISSSVGEFTPERSETYREQALFHAPASILTMSPIESTIQKTKEKLDRKKRRKAQRRDSS